MRSIQSYTEKLVSSLIEMKHFMDGYCLYRYTFVVSVIRKMTPNRVDETDVVMIDCASAWECDLLFV